MPFPMATSIHGRRLGLSSTGGIITGYNSTGQISTALEASAQMWGPAMNDSVTAVTSTIGNAGFTALTVATATAITFEIAAPVEGVYKEIHIDTSASEISLGGPTTDITFRGTAAGVGSTMFLSAANLAGRTITLRGMSTARWANIGSTNAVTIG